MKHETSLLRDRDGAHLGSGAMFDRIAPRYDLLNRVMSLGLDQRWRRRTARALALGERGERPAVLDLATGTADLAIAVARGHDGAVVTGVDPSPGMLAIAEDKIARAGLAERVRVTTGDAQELAFASDSFDGVCMAFGIRNVPDRPRALAEMARVTRPGGRIAILELSEPPRGVLGSLARFYVHVLVPRLGGLLSGSREYRYLQRSIAAFPPASEFAALMEQAGIAVLLVTPLSFAACHLYVGTPRRSASLAPLPERPDSGPPGTPGSSAALAPLPERPDSGTPGTPRNSEEAPS